MGFKEVLKSLQDHFPQIDARALRAVAFEHSKDVDAAVVAVLEEIIPFFTEISAPSSPLSHSIYLDEQSDGTQTEDCLSVETAGSSRVDNVLNNVVGGGQPPLGGDADDGPSEPFSYSYDGHREGEDNIAELAFQEKTHQNEIVMSTRERIRLNEMLMDSDMGSPGELIVLLDKLTVYAHQQDVLGDPQTEKKKSGDNCPESGIKVSSEKTPLHAVGASVDEEIVSNLILNLYQKRQDVAGNSETDFRAACNEEYHLEKSVADGNDPVAETASLTVDDVTLIEAVEAPVMQESTLDNTNACLSTDTASKPETNKIAVTEDESVLNATKSVSSDIYIIDDIEDIITDTRNNKTTLFSAMESVFCLMRQVQLREQAAEQAKLEAARGGMDLLNKAEELKQMLQYAKEGNDLDAGEVFGEKAILATELRELQSRVHSLSDKRDQSLTILDEMRQALEVRLAATEDEIKSAELEKLEKENAARKSFVEQELVMEKVVQESMILKQQAEENAILQEFLRDHGCVIDALQGEIAVIYQDVRLLKEKFDQHVLLNESLVSSQTSFVLASSNSSLKRLVPDQVQMPVADDDFFETQKNFCDEVISEEKATRDDRKALQDDGWHFFENADIAV